MQNSNQFQNMEFKRLVEVIRNTMPLLAVGLLVGVYVISAIAAGTALVALSSYAISKFQAAANNVSGGSESSTSFVGGAGGFNTAQSMQSPQLNLVGVLKGSDIYLSVQKETEKRVR